MIENQSVRTVSLTLSRQLGLTTIFGNTGSTELPVFAIFVGMPAPRGLEARRATNAAQLEEMLPAALAARRTNLIDIVVAH